MREWLGLVFGITLSSFFLDIMKWDYILKRVVMCSENAGIDPISKIVFEYLGENERVILQCMTL